MAKKYKYDAVATLGSLGIARDDAESLRRISMTLNRWFKHEANGNIQRDDTTDVPRWYYEDSRGVHHRGAVVPDREKGAIKRLKAIMAKYAPLTYYIQGDCRGASLYIIRPNDVPEGASVDAYYSRGIAVY